MAAPVSITASKNGSGPSSPQNPVPPYVQDDGQTSAANQFAYCGSGPSSPQNLVPLSMSTVGPHDPEKTKKEKRQPTVDAMDESHRPELRPYYEQKLKNKSMLMVGSRDPAKTMKGKSMLTVGSRDPAKTMKGKSMLTVGSHDPAKTKKGKLQPTVGAMVESHSPQIHPCDDRKPKQKYVRDDGQTSAVNQFATCGGGPSSPQNLVPLSKSTVGSHDHEKTKKEKLQPTVDAMDESHGPEIHRYDEGKQTEKYVQDDGETSSVNQLAPCGSGPSSLQNLVPVLQPTVNVMVESCDPEIHPHNDQKVKEKYVRDNGRTFAAYQSAPRDGTQYMPLVSQQQCPAACHQLNLLVHVDDQRISERDRKIADQQEQLLKKDQIISELQRELDKAKAEVCTKDNYLREKKAELATCRRNLGHCETEKRQLQEMFRGWQEHISYENEQLKMELGHYAGWYQQQWMMTIQPLQAQLAAGTEQFNQLLLVYQQQVEGNRRLAQQLQLEMANSRERSQTDPVESCIPQNDPQDVTQLGQNNGNQQDVNGGGSMNANSGVLPNGNTDNATSFVSSGNASTQAASEVSQISAPSQTDQNLMTSDAKDEHDTSVEGQALHSGHLDVHISPETEPDSAISPSAGKEQVLSQENDTHTISICWGSTGLTSEIRLDTIGQNSDAKELENVNLTDHGLQEEVAKVEEPSFSADASVSL